jgi:hypothetical protein
MAINGKRFLELNRTDRLVVTDHALGRLSDAVVFTPTHALAQVWFRNGRQVRADDMHTLGYRPAYRRRKDHGEQSWYFRFQVFAQECVAVVTRDGEDGPLVWVTTYLPDAQTMRFRGEPACACVA